MKYFFDTVTSLAYWRYVLFSLVGLKTVFSIFGGFQLFIGALDFFNVYAKDKYASHIFG